MHKGVFLLLEGPHDSRRFSKFLDEDVALILPCHGKANVFDTIILVQDVGYEDCLGFVDADFDRIDNRFAANDDIVHSEHHDFDVDMCRSDAVSRYLSEMCVEEKLFAAGGCKAVLESLLEGLKPLSALRYANEKLGLGYSLGQLELDVFFDGTAVNLSAMIDAVSGGRFASAAHKATLRASVERYTAAEFDLWQFTNGHDLIAAIGIALRSRIGRRAVNQTWRREVEAHLRLAFDWADFHATGLAGKIGAWQAARNGIQVIKAVA
jgi:hypothetical protein